MTYIKFKDISVLGKPAKEAFSYADIGDVDPLPPSSAAFQKQKCMCVKERLDAEGFLLTSIQQLQYNDRYTVEVPSGTVVIDCYYNASGQYTRFIPNPILPENQTLNAIFEDEGGIQFKIDYKPTGEVFSKLYTKITSLCDELGIVITNVVEHLPQFYVSYYLKTSGKYSQIQFFFNSKGFISYGMPSSDIGTDDEKLQTLINRFQ